MLIACRAATVVAVAATFAVTVSCGGSPSTPGTGGAGSQSNTTETNTAGSTSTGTSSAAGTAAVSAGGTPPNAAAGTTQAAAGGAPDPGNGGSNDGNAAGASTTGVAGTSQGGASGGPSGAAGEEVSGGDGPRFLTLGANIQTLIHGESLVLSAVLTDPDGIDDLIGGTLVDPGTGATYGTFTTAATEGSYSLTLAWSAIDQVATINADPTGVDRTFRAEFFDQAGNKSTQELTVLLKCSEGFGYGCCNGLNVFFNGDQRYNGDVACGSCEERTTGFDYACDTPPDWAVADSAGLCSNFRCAYRTVTTELTSCTAVCTALSLTCTERSDYSDFAAGTARYGTASESVETCDAVPAATLEDVPLDELECYCGGSSPDYFAEIP